MQISPDFSESACVYRELAAAEKQRQTPKAGRHVCVAGGGAMKSDGCCWSKCGPKGVPWMMVSCAMLDGTSQLRFIDLTTGTAYTLLTVGGHPDSPSQVEEPKFVYLAADAASEPVIDLASLNGSMPLLGLSLDDHVMQYDFVQDGRHIFVAGRP